MLLGGSVIVSFIFWMAGAVESFWTGLGIATLLLLFFATSLLTAAYKKTAVSILVVVLAFLFIQRMTPETVRNAVATKAVSAGVRTSVTIGNPAGEIEAIRLRTCKKDLNATKDREIRPREKELNDMNSGLLPFGAIRHNTLIREIKSWEEEIKKTADDCMEGLHYEIPSQLPSARAGATLLFAALLLSGWGIYRSTKESRWTRWVGGPLLILAALYLIYLFFNTGVDKTIEKEMGRVWEASMKESPAPPKLPPPAPPKEEKKMIAAEKEKQWRPAGPEELSYPYVWRQPGFEALFRRFRFRAGEKFGMPPIGKGGCITIVAEKGRIREMESPTSSSFSQFFQCGDNDLLVVAATDVEGFMGACRAPDRRCLVFD